MSANGLAMCKRSTLRVNCFTGGALDLNSEELCRQCVAAYRAIPISEQSAVARRDVVF